MYWYIFVILYTIHSMRMPNLNALLRERTKNCNSVLTWIVANNFLFQIFGQTTEMSTIQITIDQNSIKSRIAILFATFRKLFKQLFWYHFVMLKSNIHSFRFDTSEEIRWILFTHELFPKITFHWVCVNYLSNTIPNLCHHSLRSKLNQSNISK